jgi:hypothetical protein
MTMYGALAAATDQAVADATRRAANASIAAAVATVVLAFFTWRLARHTKKATGLTSAALTVARDQLRASVMTQLSLTAQPSATARVPVAGAVGVSATVQNLGPAPAIIGAAKVLLPSGEVEVTPDLAGKQRPTEHGHRPRP